MKRILAVICFAAVIIGLFAAAQTEGIGPSSLMRSYNAGKYKVGKNLDPGEYILFSAPFRKGFFAIFIDADNMDVISKGSFDINTILTVEEGDDLVIADCIAIFADDYYSMRRINLNQSGGMLKVGADMQAGEYDLIAQDNKTAAYRIYNDMRFRLIAEEGEFSKTCQISLEENQYLELVNCFVDHLYPEETPTPRPTPTPSPSPTPEPKTTESSANSEQSDAQTTKKPSKKKTPKPEKTSKQTEKTNRGSTPTPTPSPTPTPIPTPTPVPTPVPTPTPSPTPKIIRKVRIDPRRSPTIRSIPSTMGEKLGIAKAGAEYELLQAEKKWYKIRTDDGIEGWITAGMAEIVKRK